MSLWQCFSQAQALRLSESRLLSQRTSHCLSKALPPSFLSQALTSRNMIRHIVYPSYRRSRTSESGRSFLPLRRLMLVWQFSSPHISELRRVFGFPKRLAYSTCCGRAIVKLLLRGKRGSASAAGSFPQHLAEQDCRALLKFSTNSGLDWTWCHFMAAGRREESPATALPSLGSTFAFSLATNQRRVEPNRLSCQKVKANYSYTPRVCCHRLGVLFQCQSTTGPVRRNRSS